MANSVLSILHFSAFIVTGVTSILNTPLLLACVFVAVVQGVHYYLTVTVYRTLPLFQWAILISCLKTLVGSFCT